jgi:hypothetical protein
MCIRTGGPVEHSVIKGAECWLRKFEYQSNKSIHYMTLSLCNVVLRYRCISVPGRTICSELQSWHKEGCEFRHQLCELQTAQCGKTVCKNRQQGAQSCILPLCKKEGVTATDSWGQHSNWNCTGYFLSATHKDIKKIKTTCMVSIVTNWPLTCRVKEPLSEVTALRCGNWYIQ